MFLSACAPTGPRALLAGKKLLDAGQTEAAIAKLQTAVQFMPTNAAAWNYLGVAYHRAALWTNAAAAYSRALRYDRDLLEARFNLGCLALDQDQLEPAKAEFTAYTLRRGNASEGWTKLGVVQLRQRELAAAEQSFREALRRDGKDVEALNGLGMVFAQRNRAQDAADSFEAALKCQSDYRPALLNLATILQELNQPAEALRRYHQYLALEPRPPDWDEVAALVRQLEQPAVVVVRAPPTSPAVAVPPKPMPAPVAPAGAAPRQNSAGVAKAESPVLTAKSEPVAKQPPPPVVVVKPAKAPIVSARVEYPTVAEPTTIRAQPPTSNSKGFFSKLNPFRRGSKGSNLDNGTAAGPAPQFELEQKSESYALLTAEKSVAGDRSAAELALARGQQAQRDKRLAEALQLYLRATHLDASFFEAHYCLGLVAYEMRSFKLAATAWQNALLLRPDSGDARYNYALTLKAAARYSEAADELKKLLELHPDEARGHLILGILYAEQLRDIPQARLHYNKVLQLDPRNPQATAIRYWLVGHPR